MTAPTEDKSHIDQLGIYFQQNPDGFGWVLVGAGIIFLYGAIKRWNWLFEGGEGLFNIVWVIETFGLKTAQILVILLSIVFIATGLAWVFLHK